jgi:rhodanese-related sulfurtransferase
MLEYYGMERLGEFVVNHWVLFSILGGVLVGLAYTFVQSAKEQAPQVTPLEVTRLINHDDAQVIDIRDKGAFGKGHILGSHNVPLSDLADKIGKLDLKHERPIVVCCDAGNSAAGAVTTLSKAGFGKVYRLRGGIMDWRDANLPLARD